MTKEQLESYRSKKEEIKELEYKLAHLGEGDSMISNSVINDYRTGYPRPQSVVGVDWDKVDRLYDRYRKRLRILQKECTEVEMWVEEIPDSLTRRIFRMYFVEGMSQKQIGNIIHVDRSGVSKRIDAFLKVSHNSHNSHL